MVADVRDRAAGDLGKLGHADGVVLKGDPEDQKAGLVGQSVADHGDWVHVPYNIYLKKLKPRVLLADAS
jgi:hypothetical protein